MTKNTNKAVNTDFGIWCNECGEQAKLEANGNLLNGFFDNDVRVFVHYKSANEYCYKAHYEKKNKSVFANLFNEKIVPPFNAWLIISKINKGAKTIDPTNFKLINAKGVPEVNGNVQKKGKSVQNDTESDPATPKIEYSKITTPKTALIKNIMLKAETLLHLDNLDDFQAKLQSFIDKKKIPGYKEVNKIYFFSRTSSGVEFYKYDSDGNTIYITTFSLVAEATPVEPLADVEENLQQFEKGLMLAGYLLPNSIEEETQKDILQAHETEATPNESLVGQIVCCVCNKKLLPKNNNYNGFFDADYLVFVGTNCADKFYRYKQELSNADGKHTYSEMPIGVGNEQFYLDKTKHSTFTYQASATPKMEVLTKVEPVIENEQALPVSFAEKINIVNKATAEEWVDHKELFTNTEHHLFYPFHCFTNFPVNKMPFCCDGCGEKFTGNGSYDTAYFVFKSPNELKIYCCQSEFYYANTISYVDMLQGYKKPIVLTHKYIGSIEHELVFSLVRGSRYELNNFVTNGFKTIAELKEVIDFGDGGGSSVRNGFVELKGLKVKYFTNVSSWASKKNTPNKGDFELKPGDVLRILNEILADNIPQTKIVKTPVTTPKMDMLPGIAQPVKNESKIDAQIERINAMKQPTATTPKKEIPKQAKEPSINDTYTGGIFASGVFQFLINHVPPVETIVSGFLGHCALSKHIKPAKRMVGIDMDKTVIDKWNKQETKMHLVNGNFLENLHWINPVEFGKTFLFLDPPYLEETRQSTIDLYPHEFKTLEQHERLLNKVRKLPVYTMITHYECELYDNILLNNGFTKHPFNDQTRAGRKECMMYINYPVPTKLHDYKFYGADYRERWNNKKLIDRTIAQLKDMPELRRNMVIDSILNNF
ncbi:MAG: hypothetical protein V4538_02445 [Bacteroidota bacterium]